MKRRYVLFALFAALVVLVACNLPTVGKKATPARPTIGPSWPTAAPLITPTAVPSPTTPPTSPPTPTPTALPPTATQPPTPSSIPPTATPAVTRIRFAPGAISWTATLPKNAGKYVFYAAAGQSTEILVLKPDGKPAAAALAFWGADGTVYQTYNIGRPDWRGMLPKTQDYYISIAAPGGTAGLRLVLTIYPPMQQRKRVSNSALGFVLNYDAAISKAALPGYFDNEIVGIQLTLPGLFKGTNLQEAYFVISREDITGRDACMNTPPASGEVEVRGSWRVNGIDYTHYYTEEGAAGNIYKAELFRTYVRNTCLTVRLFTHETDIGNYGSGQVKPYDRKRTLGELKRIFFTLRWP